MWCASKVVAAAVVIGALLLLTIFVDAAPRGVVDKTLKFGPDGTFKIVQFTDLHFGEADDKDVKTNAVQTTILKAEQPDLVIMTGDSVSGYAWNGKTPNWFPQQWTKVVTPMMDLGYRWAFACGNHDDQADYNRTQIIALDQTYEYSLTQRGPSDILDAGHGITNYVLQVQSSKSPSQAAVNLYMFDSTDNNCEGVKGWGCVYPDTIEWYIETSKKLTAMNNGTVTPALAFFHIPTPEFMDMWNYVTVNGKKDEAVCCFSVNTGLYSAFKQMGDVVSVHCGHDHNNDYFGNYFGINLAYGRKTGYGGYGPPLGWLRGARVIQITESPFSIKTWIRQEDGSLLAEQPTHLPDKILPQQHICCGAEGGPSSLCEAYEMEFRASVASRGSGSGNSNNNNNKKIHVHI